MQFAWPRRGCRSEPYHGTDRLFHLAIYLCLLSYSEPATLLLPRTSCCLRHLTGTNLQDSLGCDLYTMIAREPMLALEPIVVLELNPAMSHLPFRNRTGEETDNRSRPVPLDASPHNRPDS